MNYVGQRVIIDIRRDVFEKLQRLSMSFYDKHKTGTIMSYVTNDVNALQSAMVEKRCGNVYRKRYSYRIYRYDAVSGLEAVPRNLCNLPGCTVLH